MVAFGTDMDGSKTFISTSTDQLSLMAFAFSAMLGTALFGAIASARASRQLPGCWRWSDATWSEPTGPARGGRFFLT